jgi:hypothetical protein
MFSLDSGYWFNLAGTRNPYPREDQMNTVKTLCLMFALLSTEAVLADHRDTYGSHPGRGNNSHRYQLPERGGWQHQNRYNDRRDHDVSVNVIVGNPAPFNQWAPQWRDDYRSRRDHHAHDNSTFVFNSSLGFISGLVVGTLAAPQTTYRDPYVREYREEPVVVIERNRRSTGISLFRDRFGQCYERETDYYGNEIRRRVAEYHCDF